MYQYEYPRPALSVDVVVFRRKNSTRELLLIRRKFSPFQGAWALPGGFLDENEDLETAAARELQEETGLIVQDLQQTKAYSQPKRDPRTRVISVGFIGSVSSDQEAVAGDDAATAQWFDANNLPDLAFDHGQIIYDGIQKMGETLC